MMTTTQSHGVSVDEAVAADVPAIVRQALDFNALTPYAAHIVFDPARIAAVAQQLIDSPQGLMLVAKRDGEVVGMLAAALSVHPFSGEIHATEMAWWMTPSTRGGRAAYRMFRQYFAWARAHAADVIQMVAPDSPSARFYVRCGFTPVETLYQRRLT